VTSDHGDGDNVGTEERRLDDGDERLYRQVHPLWIEDGEPSSQAFRTTKKDEGMLSIALGSKTSAEGAFLHYTQVLELASGGTWAVTVGEVLDVELSSFEQPLENDPAHGYIDFRGHGRGAMESKSKVLRAKARDRGCVYEAPG
jgi:hypothetical protein